MTFDYEIYAIGCFFSEDEGLTASFLPQVVFVNPIEHF